MMASIVSLKGCSRLAGVCEEFVGGAALTGRPHPTHREGMSPKGQLGRAPAATSLCFLAVDAT